MLLQRKKAKPHSPGILSRLLVLSRALLLALASSCVQPAFPPERPEGEALEPPAISYPFELLQEVAAALSERGLYSGRPVYGLAMQNSLQVFQHDLGLPVTGRIDPATLRTLRMAGRLAPEGSQPTGAPVPFALKARHRPVIDGAISAQPGWPRSGSSRLGSLATPNQLYPQSASVAELVDSNGQFCTGFLIGPDTLLTSGQCLADRKRCKQTVARFSMVDEAAQLAGVADYRCLEVNETGSAPDYAVVRLEGSPGLDWGYLTLSERPPVDNEPVIVLGHQSGAGSLEAVDCRVMGVDSSRLPEILVDCGREIEMPGAPVISRWNQRVIGPLSCGKTPRSPASGSTMGWLAAACRQCEPVVISGPTPGYAPLRKGEFLVAGPAGLGLIRARRDGFGIERLPADWLGKWNLGGKYRIHAANIEGDQEQDLILHNSKWLAVFKQDRGNLRPHWITHDRVGSWTLGAVDRAWTGDFNGDGRTDLLLFNGDRVGVLLAEGGKLAFAWQSGKELDAWRFGAGDQFYPGDFTGDGRQDLLVRRGEKAAVLAWRGRQLEQIWMAVHRVGSWQLHGADEHYIGDFNGDGRHEILTRRDRHLALWEMEGNRMQVRWTRQGRWDDWPLGRQDKLLVADFNGSGRDDVLIRSNRGIALQLSEGESFATSWIRFNSFEGWVFSPIDLTVAGSSVMDGGPTVLLFNPWAGGRFSSTGTALLKDFLVRYPAGEAGADQLFQ